MNIDRYENIAKLVVRANEMRKKENISAENDYRVFTENFDSGGLYRPSAAYSSFLARKGNAENSMKDLLDDTEYLAKKSSVSDRIREVMANIGKHSLYLQDSYEKEDLSYEKERDEKEDYHYNLKNDLQEKYEKSKKKTSSSSRRSSSKKASSAKKNTSVKEKADFSDMPEFRDYSGAQEGLAADVYAKAFLDKAKVLSQNGAKKADISELDRIIKLAKSLGAGDDYLRWLADVCGY